MKLSAEFIEGIRIAGGAIRANKMRSGLATLGIVIGIVTVTLMGTAITGLNGAFLRSISALGTDVLHVSRFSWFIRSHAEWMRAQSRQEISLSQIKALEEQMTLARAIAPYTEFGTPVRYKERSSRRVWAIGTTEQFQYTGNVTLAQGRFLLDTEVSGGRPVCVIGSGVASNLFLLESPLGKTIRLGDFPFEVVGVVEPQGNFLGRFSLDNQVFIPVKQMLACFTRRPFTTVQVKAVSLEKLKECEEELRGVLRKIRRVPPGDEDDFSINQQENFISTFNRVAGTIAAVGLFITGLSLFVGGIGIMNIMFVSVAERTREIGIRKAIGARRRTILLQFLIESAAICLLGGLVGLAIAFPLTLVMNHFLPAQMSLTAAGAALTVALVTGLVSGFLPAWRAARMSPVDALRNE
ncbi:MAG: ABC transporter permease [Verrucomicrobia bacterium]|nr:ABC transporter permease [Verrucomicrobiota bacterium]